MLLKHISSVLRYVKLHIINLLVIIITIVVCTGEYDILIGFLVHENLHPVF